LLDLSNDENVIPSYATRPETAVGAPLETRKMTRIPDFSLTSPAGVSAAAGDLVIAATCEGSAPVTTDLPTAVADALSRLAARPGWQGKEGQVQTTEAGEGGAQVTLYGLGAEARATRRRVEVWLRDALDLASTNRAQTVTVLLPPVPELGSGRSPGVAHWLGRALVRATYRFERYRNGGQGERRIGGVRVVLPSGVSAGDDADGVMAAVADAVVFGRDLGNTPGNEAVPAWMDERARELAAEFGMKATSFGPEELAERGMGGILAVGSGSENEPRLVRLDWGERGPRVALVGKGVTFDTGGISIKPAREMDEMKYDKCGACTVLAVSRAVAALDLPIRFSAYVPLAENMPDGRSYRPGDIVRCYNGKTVEIVNTDAEGRMLLADALAWAVEEEPDVLLEFSTLTGASVIAVGQDAASLYTPDDELAGSLLAAAEGTGERLWRMPLWPEFADRMKGAHADLKNAGGRWGSANTAAAFLSQFVGGFERWAHLDIAGGAYVGRDGDDEPGATGYGVALAVDWLRKLAAA